MKGQNGRADHKVMWFVGAAACGVTLASVACAQAQSLQAYDNYDLIGTELRSLPNTDLQTCSGACQSDNRCQAFSYNKWTQQCSLKATIGRLRFEPSSLTGVSGPMPATADLPWEIMSLQGQSLNGTPYSSPITPTYDQCTRSCQGDQQCVGISYVTQQRTCKLFQSIGGYSADQSTDSGIKHQTLALGVPPRLNELPAAPSASNQTGVSLPANEPPPRRILLLNSSLGRWAVGASSNCRVPSKTYSLSMDSGNIVWRSGIGNVDIESIDSSDETEFRTTTVRSIHLSGSGEPTGISWVYSKIGPASIHVKPGGRGPFMLARCP